MLIVEVQSKLVPVVGIGHHESDPKLKKLFAKLGPLIQADREKPLEVPGLPDLNKISAATARVLKEINERCDQAYDYTIL
jgi:hypothetical protein